MLREPLYGLKGRMRILEDARDRPDLFVWYGTAPNLDLQSWQRRRGLKLPCDLLLLWERTGGGDIFETETLIGPAPDPEWADSFDDVNEWYRKSGLPHGFAIFHIGRCLSAIRLSDGKYTILEENSNRILREYETLDEWYEHELRDEYADAYGLSGGTIETDDET